MKKKKNALATSTQSSAALGSRNDRVIAFLPTPDSAVASRVLGGESINSVIQDLNLNPLDLVATATARTEPNNSLIGEYILQLLWSDHTQSVIRRDRGLMKTLDIKTPNDLTSFVSALPPSVMSSVLKLLKNNNLLK